jgi:hypothetical protein
MRLVTLSRCMKFIREKRTTSFQREASYRLTERGECSVLPRQLSITPGSTTFQLTLSRVISTVRSQNFFVKVERSRIEINLFQIFHWDSVIHGHRFRELTDYI